MIATQRPKNARLRIRELEFTRVVWFVDQWVDLTNFITNHELKMEAQWPQVPTAILDSLGTGTFFTYKAEKALWGLSWISHVTTTTVLYFPPIRYELRAKAVSIFSTWVCCVVFNHWAPSLRKITIRLLNSFVPTVSSSVCIYLLFLMFVFRRAASIPPHMAQPLVQFAHPRNKMVARLGSPVGGASESVCCDVHGFEPTTFLLWSG